MPSHNALAALGLDADEIESVQSAFKSVPRKASGGIAVANSELERMILEHDCSSVEVGLIRFLDRPREHRYGIQIAICEADAMVVSASGSIVMHDHAAPDKAMKCAADSERFLDALSSFVLIRKNKVEWEGRAHEAARVCAAKAGGDEYTEFFKMLCGFLDR